MERLLGPMNIMSSKRLLAQPVVTACGRVEEGPSSDELRLRILGIVSGNVETHGHTNVELPKAKMMK